MSYGLSAAGFTIKPFETIKSELEAAYRAELGASIDTTPESVLGQLIGIHAEREAELWELGLALWNSRQPDYAEGVSLDELAGLTGTVREPPRKSTVTATWYGSAGTSIPAGRVASVAGYPDRRFVTLADATVGGGGSVAVAMESEDYGPIVANAGTLTVIETPVGGITSVTNALDAEVGADEETDAALRIRREEELRAQGEASIEAIRSELLQMEGVTSVTVFHNPTDATDADGIPPHAVEAMVQGGADADIREALFSSVAAGIATHGTESGTVTDEQGDTHTVEFTRPEELDIKVEVTFEHTADYPLDGDAQVKAAVVNFAEGRFGVAGKDVILSALESPVWSVDGIYDVTQIRASIDPAALGTSNISVDARELPAFDTSRVTLVKTLVAGS
jgi:uncharacterized phage protein gp47/JayE